MCAHKFDYKNENFDIEERDDKDDESHKYDYQEEELIS